MLPFATTVFSFSFPFVYSNHLLDYFTKGYRNLVRISKLDIMANASDSDEAVTPESDRGSVAFEDNGLRLDFFPEGLEKLYDYEAGGHHPVHLGDLLGNQRYKVLHKLGNGGAANVWLCQDTNSSSPKYIAIKILIADEPIIDCPELLVKDLEALKDSGNPDSVGLEYVALPLDTFELEGPNGRHLCLVYYVSGPRASLGFLHKSENADSILRKMSWQAVQALQALHSHGICHGGMLRVAMKDHYSEKLTKKKKRLDASKCFASNHGIRWFACGRIDGHTRNTVSQPHY